MLLSVVFLVGWPKPNCHKLYMLQYNEASTWQLSNFDLGPPQSTNSSHHANNIHAACYSFLGSNPAAAKFFLLFIRSFILGLANGAKVGPKA